MHALPEDIAKYKGKYDGGYEPIRKARFEKARKLGLIDPKWPLTPTAGDWSKVPDKAWEAALHGSVRGDGRSHGPGHRPDRRRAEASTASSTTR